MPEPTTVEPAPSPEGGLWWRWAAAVIFPGHLLLTELTFGARFEHLALDLLLLITAWAGPTARRFSMLAAPFAFGGMTYEAFHYLQPLRGTIHVGDLYNAELALFAVPGSGGSQTFAAWFGTHNTPALDFLTGLSYATYVAWPPLLGIWLFFMRGGRHRDRMSRLAWAFFVMHAIGTIVWLVWPAAPPWYVAEHGVGPAVLDAAQSAAGAARFDALVGTSFFASYYARSANVFGAMPSLHVAYTIIALCAVVGVGRGLVVFAASFAAVVSFAAVYLGHHYVLDVVMGAVTGVAAWGISAAGHRLIARGFAPQSHRSGEMGAARPAPPTPAGEPLLRGSSGAAPSASLPASPDSLASRCSRPRTGEQSALAPAKEGSL